MLSLQCSTATTTILRRKPDMGLQPRLTVTTAAAIIFTLQLLFPAAISQPRNPKTFHRAFGPFTFSDYGTFHVIPPASINFGALQVTPDTAGNVNFTDTAGRILYRKPFKLWEASGKLASFNTSFLLNVFRVNNGTPGEGVAFVISPSLDLPRNSHGQYLGLTNAATDGNSTNQIVAVELDTVKQDFDPDDNHIGLDINTVRSNHTVSLSQFGIQIAPNGTKFYVIWIDYSGTRKSLNVFITEQPSKDAPIVAKPEKPILTADLDLKSIVKQRSYLGFSASTGTKFELNCVLRWNLTVELLPEHKKAAQSLRIGLGIGVCVLIVMGGLGYYVYRRRRRRNGSDELILGTLKSLPGTPREFSFKELKKATNNFDEKHKLGEGGFGVVYRGNLVKEKMQVAVKKFSRDNMKSKDDFLAELTIINRLRHKHLVRLLGWCHKNGVLLLVYEFMPNGSLDNHLFCDEEGSYSTSTSPLSWHLRYKIISGVASALHYLHNEYDQKVVHRDLKASNIMLDSDFNARLGDFGLARALEHEKTSYAELGAGVHGTMGYIAPECFHTGTATRPSDVYGFGAVLLEVVCGQRPWTKNEGYQCLVDWVWSLFREGRVLEAVDPRLGHEYVEEEAERILKLGLACSHPIASERPKMQSIVQIISGSVPVPHVPPFKPAFVWPAAVDLASFASDFNFTTASTVTDSTTPTHSISNIL